MTAEIAVMNRDAVALAADSAVTIQGSKTYHTTNKLFSLNIEQPVGLMVYGDGLLAGVPWETIVKLYRKHIGPSQKEKLVDYVSGFLEFLENEFVHHFHETPIDDLSDYADDYLNSLFDRFHKTFDEVTQDKGQITDFKISQLIRGIVKEDSRKWSEKDKLSFYSAKLKKQLSSAFREKCQEMVNEFFENQKISADTHKLIASNVLDIFFSFNLQNSGVVFSGFGEHEIFPNLIELHFETVVNGKVKFSLGEVNSIDVKNGSTSAILPFAQSNTVASFMNGYSLDVHEFLMDYYRSGLFSFIEFLKSEASVFKGQVEFDSFLEKFLDGYQDFYKRLFDDLKVISREKHIDPVVEAVGILPKNEMAEVAESLVSLTSFRQKISLEHETVGGAIDVAVISKCDGFVWIKRKHYFEPEFNPMFMSRYRR